MTCIIGVKISRKIYILYDFWCAQTSLFVPSRFCFWTIRTLTPSAKPLYSDVREKNHRPIYYVHINILGPKQYCVEFFFKSLSYLYKVCEQTFPPIFGLSTVFDRNFANIVAPATWQCKWASERAIISEKNVEKASKSTHKSWHNTFSNYVPTHRQTKRGKQKTPHFRTLQPARVVRSLANFAW